MVKGADKPPSCLNDIFPNVSPGLIDILESMLQFNPYFRPTVKELIKHYVFDSIRTKTDAKLTHKINIELD